MKRAMRSPGEFDTIYHALFPLLFRISYRITGDTTAAEDLCQEAFVRYLQRTAPLPSPDQAKYWLIRVVRNLSYNYEKRKGRERRALDRLYHEPKRNIASLETEALRSESSKLVQEALKRLPFKLRTSLVLREYAGLSYREIARSLHISESNVKVRVFRARELLKKILDEEDLHVS
jgi:RNA polymerase sigma-70 factor (ECF subfamily)